jgi:hypothetical protein
MEEIETAYSDFLSQFAELWGTRIDGNTFRIDSPLTTVTCSFISVFVVKQGNEYVVHDDGYLFEGQYCVEVNKSEMEAVREILEIYLFKMTDPSLGGIRVYKKVSDLQGISTAIFYAINCFKSLVDVIATSKE